MLVKDEEYLVFLQPVAYITLQYRMITLYRVLKLKKLCIKWFLKTLSRSIPNVSKNIQKNVTPKFSILVCMQLSFMEVMMNCVWASLNSIGDHYYWTNIFCKVSYHSKEAGVQSFGILVTLKVRLKYEVSFLIQFSLTFFVLLASNN